MQCKNDCYYLKSVEGIEYKNYFGNCRLLRFNEVETICSECIHKVKRKICPRYSKKLFKML
jgi:hypothetical protein